MMRESDIPALPRGVRLHYDKVRDTWVLLAPERVVRLDAAGRAVLGEVDGHRSFGEITRSLAKRYDAPVERIATDSAGFLNALRNRRFLDVRS